MILFLYRNKFKTKIGIFLANQNARAIFARIKTQTL